jgi:O-antigen/teichoic acid export membrane protein
MDRAEWSWARLGRDAIGAQAVAVLVTIVSGVLVARELGPSGRGVVLAAQVGPLLAGWVFSLGAAQAVAHQIASHPEDRRALLGAWLRILLPLAACAVAILEFTVPVLLHAQSPETRSLARAVGVTGIGSVLAELLWGILLGDGRFREYNVVRVGPSVTMAASYGAIAAAGAFTTTSALICACVSNTIPLAYLVRELVISDIDWHPPLSVIRRCTAFGLRLQGATLGMVVNTRLDLLILPAFATSRSLGYYSAATNISSLVIAVGAALYPFLIPVASRSRQSAFNAARVTLSVTVGLSAALALGIGLISGVAVRLMYGASFAPSVSLIRLLLPGTIAYAAARILLSAIVAHGRPGAASLCELAGVALTIPGLLLALPTFGVSAAAVTSSVAYCAVGIACAWVHLNVSARRWSDYWPTRDEWKSVRRRIEDSWKSPVIERS